MSKPEQAETEQAQRETVPPLPEVTGGTLATRAGAFALAPQNFTEAMEFARMVAESAFAPKDFRGRPGDVLVAMQYASEIGIGPVQGLQNIAVINGRPSIYGDLAIALVIRSGLIEDIREWTDGEGDDRAAHFMARRRGLPTQIERSFSIADAKRAKLATKPGPWQDYPDRMLQMRARGFGLRDGWADVLKGLILREEAEDIPPPTPIRMPEAKKKGKGKAALPPSDPPVRDDRVITADQLKRLHTIAGKSGLSVNDIKAYLVRRGYESSKSIARSDYDSIVGWIERGGVDEPPPE